MFKKQKKDLIADGVGDLNSVTELTLLNPKATEKDVLNIANIAYKNRYYGIVVFPMFVRCARDYIDKKLDGAIKIIATIDFPFGCSNMTTKVAEAKRCFSDGADEVDVTICSSKIIEENYSDIKSELLRIVRSAHGKVVKAVIEASYLNREQLTRLSRVLIKSKVDFVMTNTVFGDGGATPEVVEILNANLKGRCGIKASGAISNKMMANNMLRMGATRIGTSRVL